jgi:hypothetical protein
MLVVSSKGLWSLLIDTFVARQRTRPSQSRSGSGAGCVFLYLNVDDTKF